mmetsp:Transcript_133444/g.230897  ORF Transcript_133444/g.230897 Transcript_133444/m.230897 type:complete len:103 (-) Transcript_133444:1407-1715(-)
MRSWQNLCWSKLKKDEQEEDKGEHDKEDDLKLAGAGLVRIFQYGGLGFSLLFSLNFSLNFNCICLNLMEFAVRPIYGVVWRALPVVRWVWAVPIDSHMALVF